MQWYLFFLTVMVQNHLMVCQLYQYHYVDENKTWTEAQQYCRENHTDLVTVTNMKDMKRLINISAGDQSEAWIGLYDQTNTQRSWHWSLPGVEFNESETNWETSTNEPNNLGGQNCVIIWKNSPFFLKWGDISCNEKHNFLCYNDFTENDSSQKYHLIYESKNWTEAQSYCREKHTDLISGKKQLQDGEVNKGLNLTTANSRYIFIGLFSDTWMWSDGNSFSFRHWNLKFDNQRINSGQCAMTVFDDGGRWKNENCDKKKPFICYDDKVILIKENKTWHEALTYCRGHGHDLVTITNMDDQILIQEKVKEASTPFVWLGLRFSCLQKIWFWVCKKNATFEGQINDCEISGAMEAGGKHMWFQRNNTEKLNFFCHKL
ncbi:PREDICTED: macrophage mannose receptor 1-like [Poecilia mexicana]|uniref:macrophage mannose receptor 1-like n=1 Tax=Poecilia mexicana TaxID=48701 RepID=UPI00072EA2DA|nr:PREDICTED: macrophage mannose receptor 1-like [Poecilia mexicana]